VIGVPPVVPGDTATIAALSPRVTPLIAGVPGVVAATKEEEAAEAALSPTVFVATTVQVYVRPFESDVTVIGELTPVFDFVVPPVLETHVTL